MRAGLQASFRLGAAVPFHLISAFSHFLIAIASGSTYLGTDGVLTSGDFLRYLTDCRITACAGSPLQVRWLCEAAPRHPAAAQLRWLLSVGDHLSEDLIDQAHVALPACDIVVGYGLTEAAGRVCMRIAKRAHAGGDAGVGRPILGCRVSAFNDSGSPLAHGEVGTLYVKSAWLLTGYSGEIDASLGRAPPDWLCTGDTGYLDASGNVFIVGRDDDLFKVGGLKVSAVRIQDALLSLGRFRDVAVTSRDLGMGRVPIVLYVPRENTGLDKCAVMQALRRILPRNHLPWDFVEVSAIPRTQTGKVDRRRAALLSATSSNWGGRTCTPAS
jgi:acyl-coenzyme A synthetase/AMP-(fatty) acid ligase